MEEKLNLHVENRLLCLCRLCAKQTEEIQNLFETVHNGKHLSDMLKFCLQRSIERNELLPVNICFDCSSKLISTHEFHLMCIASEQHFRNDLNTEKILVETKPSTQVEVIYANIENIVFHDKDIKLEDENNDFLSTNYDEHFNFDINFEELDDNILSSNNRFESSVIDIPQNHRILNRARSNRIKRDFNPTNIVESYECFECKESFCQVNNLRRHLHQHAINKKPFECSTCKMRFVHQKSLFRHRYKHSNQIHECEYCSKSFETVTLLKKVY